MMSKITLGIVCIICFCSCSDNLSNSKAEDILKECLEKTPYRKTVSFQYGERTKFNKDKEEFTKLENLVKQGYLSIDSLGQKNVRFYGKYTYYNISLTDKAKPLIINQTEQGKKQYVEILAFKYELDKVIEVHEIPAMNSAEVKANYEKVDVSPFAVLTNESGTDFKIRNLSFKKTSNGWKYCD